MNYLVRHLGLALIISISFSSIDAQSVNWYQDKRSGDAPFNINTDEVYEELLKNRTGIPVVVAVIDSGVDIDHEDLKDVIWINNNEIADNGLDDDGNGYVDDINGWNFIGGRDGSHVGTDTYEMTRLYAQFKKRFDHVNPSDLGQKDLDDYNTYIKYGKRIEKEVKSAKEQYAEFEQRFDFFAGVLDHIKRLSEEVGITKELIDSLSTSFNPSDAVAANIFNFYNDEIGYYPEVETLRKELIDPLEDGMEYFGNKFKYSWNPDFDPRHIVGDDYANVNERYYGNNSVKGPDAMHGTHVAGIIAASRNNNIGINGIATNTRIMVLRAVPDGDERDKDVANAIRYAVENGASIINMSFGKGASPNKQVVDDAIRFAEKNDVLIVHAAGNSSENLSEAENYPNDYFIKPKGFLFFKKKQPKNYITIGASGPTKDDNMVAGFSNYSQKDVDLFAPGVMMLSTVPDNQYEVQQGTSMAAPVVSGVAAILRSYFPELTARQIKEALVKSTTPDHTMVTKPGTDEKVLFSSLSLSGGIIDMRAAFTAAASMKGKKKYKAGSQGKDRA